MKKISLVLCFALLLVAVFAITAFAASKNIANDARLEQDGSTCDSAFLDIDKIRDGDYNTASSCGNAGQDWINYRFYYDEGVTVSKVVVILNSTGTSSSGKTFDTVSTSNYEFYVRLYKQDCKSTYIAVQAKAADAGIPVTDENGTVLYTYYELVLDQPFSDVYMVEVPVVNKRNADICLWEVEIYDYACESDADHIVKSDKNCTTAGNCIVCGAEVDAAMLHKFDPETNFCTNGDCEVYFVRGCYEDYEIGDTNLMEKWYGDSEVKDENGTYLGGYQGGGNNSFAGIFNNNTTNTGWGGGAAPRYNGEYNMTFFYKKSHLVRETTVYFNVHAAGGGFKVELSNDGGATWTEIGDFTATALDVGNIVPVTFLVNNGEGMMANAYRFTWKNKYTTFQVSVVEIDIKASNRIACQFNDGVVDPAADCGNDGVKTYTCTSCGDYYTEVIPATGLHTWDEGVVSKPATEEEDGIKTYTCQVCGDTYEETISAIQHVYVATVTPPTCTTKGYTTYTCNGECGIENCAATYVDINSYVAEIPHSYVEEVTIKATALNQGLLTYTCSECGDSYEKTVAKLGWGDNVSVIGNGNVVKFEPTYTTADGNAPVNADPSKLFNGKVDSTWTQGTGNGWYGPSGSTLLITLDQEYYVISVEFQAWSNWNSAKIELLNAKGETVASWSRGDLQDTTGSAIQKADTLSNALGVKYIKITINSAKGELGQCLAFQELKVTVHNHDRAGEVENYVDPTCDTTGSYDATCSVCGLAFHVDIPALGHTTEGGSEATCSAAAVCGVCGESFGDKLAHTLENGTAATCTEAAICGACGESFGEPAGHNYESETTVPATCVQDGTMKYTCSVCGDSYTEAIPMDTENGHDMWEMGGNPATCVSAGTVNYWCFQCGYTTTVDEDINPENHDWSVNSDTFVAATCTTKGYRERTCTLCGANESGEIDVDTEWGHNYVVDEESFKEASCYEGGYANYICDYCGDSYVITSEPDESLHDYVYAANGLFKACNVCNTFGLTGTINGGNEDAVADYSVYFMGTDVLNIYNTNDYSALDEFYYYTITKNEDGTYTLAIGECYNGADTFKLANTTAIFEIKENGGVLTLTNADGAVYTFDNLVETPDVDPNSILNGTYAYLDMGGNVNFKVKFEDGVVYVLEDNMMLNLPESFAYEFNPTTGMIITEEIGNFFSYSNGDIYAGRGWYLTPVEDEEPVDPEVPEVNYGEWFGSMIVMTENSYGFNNLADTEHAYYTFTAEAAGSYSFYLPAGLGFWTKTSYDAWGNPEVEFMDNAAGEYTTIVLAAGESVEFSVGANEEKGWEIVIYYLAPSHTCEFVETNRVDSTCTTAGYVTYECECGESYTEDLELAAHTEAVIPAVPGELRNPGMTSGVKCSVCDTVLVAPVQASGDFRIGAVALNLGENISIVYKAAVPAGYENVYMVFEMVVVEDGEEVVKTFVVEDYEIGTDGRYWFTFSGIRLQYMADLVTATVYAENNGVVSANSYSDYSVKTYIVNQISKTSNALKLRTMLSDLLVLGAKTQIYANYKADTLMTADVDASILTTSTYAGVPSDAFVQKMIVNDEATRAIADWKAVSLTFKDAMSIQFKLAIDPAQLENIEIKVTVPVYNGEARVDTYTAEDLTFSASENRYILYVDNIKASQYGQTIVGDIYVGGEKISRTVNYSVNSYIQKNQDSTNVALRDFLRAAYLYGESVFAYAYNK